MFFFSFGPVELGVLHVKTNKITCKQAKDKDLRALSGFLAYLSRRLIAELIVYQSLRRASVVRLSTFSNIFSSETTGPIKLKFHMETP